MTRLILAYLAIAVPWTGFGVYAIMTVRGADQPNRVSWAGFTFGPCVAFAAELDARVPLRTALVTLIFGLGPALVLAASFSRRDATWLPEKRWKRRLNVACGIVCAAGLAAWWVTRHAAVAIVLAVAADAAAALPTIASPPAPAAAVTYACSAAGAELTLALQPGWTLAAGLFPVYVTAVCLLILLLIARKTVAARRRRRQRALGRHQRRLAQPWPR